MELIAYIFIFIAGTFIGSFLNVVSDRIKTKESILFGRSHCDFCKQPLSGSSLIPLLSFIFQKSKCKSCGHKLSYYYPFSEILTGAAFVLIAYFVGIFRLIHPLQWVGFTYLIVVASFYIILLLTDMKFRIIPNRVVYSGIFFVLFFILLNTVLTAVLTHTQLKNDEFGKYLLEVGYWKDQMITLLRGVGIGIGSAFLISLFFWFLIVITRGKGMGGGDVKLAFLIGLVNGFPNNVIGVFLGFVIGALFSILLILLKKRSMKDTIAFGPFLILGGIIAFAYGFQILDWYMNLLG